MAYSRAFRAGFWRVLGQALGGAGRIFPVPFKITHRRRLSQGDAHWGGCILVHRIASWPSSPAQGFLCPSEGRKDIRTHPAPRPQRESTSKGACRTAFQTMSRSSPVLNGPVADVLLDVGGGGKAVFALLHLLGTYGLRDARILLESP